MSNQSFSDLPSQQRRERIAAVLAMGLARVLDQRSKISANSHDPSLELLSGLWLSVSEVGRRREALGRRSESCFIPKSPNESFSIPLPIQMPGSQPYQSTVDQRTQASQRSKACTSLPSPNHTPCRGPASTPQNSELLSKNTNHTPDAQKLRQGSDIAAER